MRPRPSSMSCHQNQTIPHFPIIDEANHPTPAPSTQIKENKKSDVSWGYLGTKRSVREEPLPSEPNFTRLVSTVAQCSTKEQSSTVSLLCLVRIVALRRSHVCHVWITGRLLVLHCVCCIETTHISQSIRAHTLRLLGKISRCHRVR